MHSNTLYSNSFYVVCLHANNVLLWYMWYISYYYKTLYSFLFFLTNFSPMGSREKNGPRKVDSKLSTTDFKLVSALLFLSPEPSTSTSNMVNSCDEFSSQTVELSCFMKSSLRYSLQFLLFNGVQKILIFCANPSHADGTESYLDVLKNLRDLPRMVSVRVVCASKPRCSSLGDSLRELHLTSSLHTFLGEKDFLILRSDIVRNYTELSSAYIRHRNS